jgi:3-deoxy-D-manno-octulosonic-acid transferase
MNGIYTFVVGIYYLIIIVSSFFNRKARAWLFGRKHIFRQIKEKIEPGNRIVWFHCASLGEFEQGRPVIERLRQKDPGLKILLTFFSPSGYEIRKNYSMAEYIFYLPFDFRRNARKFLDIVKPSAAVFVKYEFWYHYISELNRRDIPVYCISAIFRESQLFFKWYGRGYRKMLSLFSHIFVQDEPSKDLLLRNGVDHVTTVGDTRFDRVAAIARCAAEIPIVQEFSEGRWVAVAGSTWKEDEELLTPQINSDPGICWIIAPHEIDEEHLSRLEGKMKRQTIRFSKVAHHAAREAEILIIDNIGMLSSLYRYGNVAYIGGGFGKGIHNILEAAVYGVPVIFGPGFKKFREAVMLVSRNGAFPVHNYVDLAAIISRFRDDRQFLTATGNVCKSFVNNSVGATEKIVDKFMNG